MIDSILKETRTPDQKPRFFLHDEVKAWLADNLQVTVKVAPNYSANYGLQQKLQKAFTLYNPPLAAFAMETTVLVAGEPIQYFGSNTLMTDNEQIYDILASYIPGINEHLSRLQTEVTYLRQEIDALKQMQSYGKQQP